MSSHYIFQPFNDGSVDELSLPKFWTADNISVPGEEKIPFPKVFPLFPFQNVLRLHRMHGNEPVIKFWHMMNLSENLDAHGIAYVLRIALVFLRIIRLSRKQNG